MERPDFSSAEISDAKLAGYLLSNTHPAGRTKAAFFTAVGFSADKPQELAAALRRQAVQSSELTLAVTRFGTKWLVEGPMETPGGRAVVVRSVWFLEAGQTGVRFVTAYPARGLRS